MSSTAAQAPAAEGLREGPPDEQPHDQGPSSRSQEPLQRPKRRQTKLALWLLAPTMVLLAVVIGYPVISAVVMSFQQDALLNNDGFFVPGGFAGLSNYIAWLFQQCPAANGTQFCPPGTLGAQFWEATGNTFFFTIVTVALETVIGFWMAVIMARSFRGRGLVRAAVLVPWAIPTAVTAKLFFFMFAFDGVINKALGTQILWTGQEWPAKFAIIIADTWKTTPFMALLILAGLQMIPKEVYEAARVDGATAWQRFRMITLPMVKPALMVAILFRTLDALRMFDLPYILTGGANGTTTLSILVINQIRSGFNLASALSTITFVVIFLVAFVFVRFLGANAVASSTGHRKGK